MEVNLAKAPEAKKRHDFAIEAELRIQKNPRGRLDNMKVDYSEQDTLTELNLKLGKTL